MKALTWHGTRYTENSRISTPRTEDRGDFLTKFMRTAVCGSHPHLDELLASHVGVGGFPGREPMDIVRECGLAVASVKVTHRMVFLLDVACGCCWRCALWFLSQCGTLAVSGLAPANRLGARHRIEPLVFDRDIAARPQRKTSRGPDPARGAVCINSHGSPVSLPMHHATRLLPEAIARKSRATLSDHRIAEFSTAVVGVCCGETASFSGVWAAVSHAIAGVPLPADPARLEAMQCPPMDRFVAAADPGSPHAARPKTRAPHKDSEEARRTHRGCAQTPANRDALGKRVPS